MDIGAVKGALTGFRQPLLSDQRQDFARADAPGGSSSSSANPIGFNGSLASGAPPRRARAKESIRRGGTPIRTADARSSLKRTLGADDCYAMCVAGGFDLLRLEGQLKDPGSRAGSERNSDMRLKQRFSTGEDLVLHLQLFGRKDVFLFRFGALVCWSMQKSERDSAKDWLRPFMQRELAPKDVEEEHMEFVVERRTDLEAGDDEEMGDSSDDGKNGPVRQDQIVLTTDEPFELLAHSYALAQSVRLGVFEITVSRSIERTRTIPEQMAATGEVALDHNNLSKEMGGLLMLRCDVNLHTDILDTPEIFWDEEKFEPHYVACRKYLDVDKRVEILNQRLVVLKDMYDLLQNGLNVKHGNKLEWIIIILILLEVLLELLELVHDAWAK
mmetsp:Transcript_35320/g.82482  ORF Transcript_35320/g.82482 Transcript_35320/m.82482 type:complete len:386 (+) Transcript_35320:93-1250(+)